MVHAIATRLSRVESRSPVQLWSQKVRDGCQGVVELSCLCYSESCSPGCMVSPECFAGTSLGLW